MNSTSKATGAAAGGGVGYLVGEAIGTLISDGVRNAVCWPADAGTPELIAQAYQLCQFSPPMYTALGTIITGAIVVLGARYGAYFAPRNDYVETVTTREITTGNPSP